MKKLFLLLAFAGFVGSAFAETTVEESYPTLKRRYVTNTWRDNWFVMADVAHLTTYGSNQEALFDAPNQPFWKGRSSYTLDLSVGRWATPGFGGRVKVQAGKATVVASESKNNAKYDVVSIVAQPMFNLTNLIGGYKPRWWEISAYMGAGVMRNCSHDETNGLYASVLEAGVLNVWNVTERFNINLDVYVRSLDDDIDGVNQVNTYLNKRTFRTRDLHFGIAAGIGVNLGKVGWDKAPDMDAVIANQNAQVDALNSTIAALEAENADLKNKLAKKPKEVVKTVKEFASMSLSIFFDLDKSNIRSKKDLIDLQGVADYAKANDKVCVVIGYCDSATGSAGYNQGLSERRAQTVADELVKMGVSRDKIEVSGRGGVAEMDPYQFDRRVVVTLK